MRSFVKMKSSRKGEITMSFTDMSKTCPNRIFYIANMSFNAIRKNKTLAKISEFTVSYKLQNYTDRYSFVKRKSPCSHLVTNMQAVPGRSPIGVKMLTSPIGDIPDLQAKKNSINLSDQ